MLKRLPPEVVRPEACSRTANCGAAENILRAYLQTRVTMSKHCGSWPESSSNATHSMKRNCYSKPL